MSCKEDSTNCCSENSAWLAKEFFYQNTLKEQISIFAKAGALKIFAKPFTPQKIIH